ncbi:PfaD family polyunsaturated fatty acid/polyketide biosynthesis protein [Dyella silvatica]|uniref:PfaD family polyunsaturated fatty acid/polyketide biosynthesis protein n=1 Tax=Dyella silvatica TaxID=2992128 RepID=UPI00225B1987
MTPVATHHVAVTAETLGSAAFRQRYGLRLSYMAGAMANGIAGEALVEALLRAGCLASFGAAGLPLPRVQAAISHLRGALPGKPLCFNLIHTPDNPAHERAAVELYLRERIEIVEASAFMALTPALVLYRARGAHIDSHGQAHAQQRLIAKISRREVAQAFMRPAPEAMLLALQSEGALSASEVAAARLLPMADDVTVEADSGGHTDRQSLLCAWPSLAALRAQIAHEFPPAANVGLGAGGGLGTPESIAAAFAMGVDYVVTGSINQACVEASTSDAVKKLLASAGPADVSMAPAADMFELGVSVQVLKRGSMFAARANQLWELYRYHPSLDAVPANERERLEQQIFLQPLSHIEAETLAFWQQRHPALAERARQDPRTMMGLVFRWYLGQSSRWAIQGEVSRVLDYQVWCGQAMGAFNAWAAGGVFAQPQQRRAADIAQALMSQAAMHVQRFITQLTATPALASPAPRSKAPIAASVFAPAATATASDDIDLQEWLMEQIAKEAGVSIEDIDPRRTFESYALDSAHALLLLSQLEQRLSLKLSPTLVWNYPTIEKLAARLQQMADEAPARQRVPA